jgi:hypothetical protein
MSKFNPAMQPFPRPHYLPDGRVMHESGLTVTRPDPTDDEDMQEPQRPTPCFQRPVIFYPTY